MGVVSTSENGAFSQKGAFLGEKKLKVRGLYGITKFMIKESSAKSNLATLLTYKLANIRFSLLTHFFSP